MKHDSMKTKRTILLAFLLMLYIGPSLFAMTSYSLPSPTEPNTGKEFSLSAYGDESPDSITSFSETLPDDVLYYPDSFSNTTKITASSGDDDYADSTSLDSVYWDSPYAAEETAN
ncbi:MAG TPA: hypothetical protein VMW50_00060, partial [Dehalococcoidia bacterium]|nr:hypothetical protein [Dehalococcoidia bacterium]